MIPFPLGSGPVRSSAFRLKYTYCINTRSEGVCNCYSFRMAWVFIEHTEPDVCPWVWEWGSPESFRGRRECGCPCCETCLCNVKHTTSEQAKLDSRQRGHTLKPLAGDRHRLVKLTSPPYGWLTVPQDSPDLMTPAEPAQTHAENRKWPKAQIAHGKAGDDHLLRYYKKHGTFNGATVYMKPGDVEEVS